MKHGLSASATSPAVSSNVRTGMWRRCFSASRLTMPAAPTVVHGRRSLHAAITRQPARSTARGQALEIRSQLGRAGPSADGAIALCPPRLRRPPSARGRPVRPLRVHPRRVPGSSRRTQLQRQLSAHQGPFDAFSNSTHSSMSPIVEPRWPNWSRASPKVVARSARTATARSSRKCSVMMSPRSMPGVQRLVELAPVVFDRNEPLGGGGRYRSSE